MVAQIKLYSSNISLKRAVEAAFLAVHVAASSDHRYYIHACLLRMYIIVSMVISSIRARAAVFTCGCGLQVFGQPGWPRSRGQGQNSCVVKRSRAFFAGQKS